MASPDYIDLPGPDDFHVHLRDGDMLAAYAKTLASSCSRALVMPNTVPAITTPELLCEYRRRIIEAAPDFQPLCTFKLTGSLRPDAVAPLAASGALAGKLYPVGVTTNASDGIADPGLADELFCEMENHSLVLCIHAESPTAGVLEREREYLPEVERIVSRHPNLRVVVEHVSDRFTVGFVREMPDTVAATVTAHHLLYTIDDLLGDGVRPHLYCKPLLKSKADREAIREAVLSGDPRFFFGSDSAPHPVTKKECGCGAAGVYAAPSALALLIAFFESEGAIGKIGAFVGVYGADFYRIPRPIAVRRFMRERWRVPGTVDGAVPLGAGSELDWRVAAGK